jgi:hypothetical protein
VVADVFSRLRPPDVLGLPQVLAEDVGLHTLSGGRVTRW